MERPVPNVLGGFELIERVAVGGMASLYLARRAGARGFVRPVAVKLVHEHLREDPEFVEMFVDEANICSRLDHPNIVHVEELGEAEGFLYLVMEFVEGCSLGAAMKYMRAKKTPMPLALTVHLVAAAADGLHAAHEARGDRDEPLSIVHRDVSPSNLLLSRTGHLKIIDFGIAKSSDRRHRTTTRKIKGKIAYMSPEQLRYEPIDRRTDIYSLGIVLWEMLANQRAFRAPDEASLIHEVTTKSLPPIDSIRDDLPGGLLEALSRATQRSVEARFETAVELRHALIRAVPEALAVSNGQVADFVRRVLAAKGSDIAMSQRLVRTGSTLGAEATQITPSAVPIQEPPPPSTPTPFPAPSDRTERRLVAAVGGAAVLSAALVVAALWAPTGGPRVHPEEARIDRPGSGENPIPTSPTEPGRGAMAGEVAPAGASEGEKAAVVPVEAADPDLPEDDEGPAEVKGQARAGGAAAVEEGEDTDPARASRPSDRGRRAHLSRSEDDERRRSRRSPTPGRSRRPRGSSPPGPDQVDPEAPTPPPPPIEVDGALLAGPDALDRLNVTGDGEPDRSVAVERDGVMLADEYQ